MTSWEKGMKVVVVVDDGRAGTPILTTIVLVTGKYVHTDATYKFDVGGPVPIACGPGLGPTWLLTVEEYEVFKYRKRVYMEMLDALERAPSAWTIPIELIVAIGDALSIGRPACLIPEPISFPYEVGWDADAKPFVRKVSTCQPVTLAEQVASDVEAAKAEEDAAVFAEVDYAALEARVFDAAVKSREFKEEINQVAGEYDAYIGENHSNTPAFTYELGAQACEGHDA